MRPLTPYFLAGALLAGIAATPGFAADPCDGFNGDVSKEHVLFKGAAVSVAAGKDLASAPAITADRLYRMRLTPQNQVVFAAPPGKTMITDGAYAGLATFKLSAGGAYRISVDVPFWIDVVARGQLVATKDFQGQRGCDAPHKIVEYELTAMQPLILQLSGATQSDVRLTVTRSPDGER